MSLDAPPREVTALVVECDSSNAALERVVIEHCGFRVTVASNGHDALRAIRALPFDVIVVGSPVPLGHDQIVLDYLPEAGNSARRTVVVTALSEDPELLRRALAANVYAVVAKPFDIAGLVAVVQQCLANAGAAGDTILPRHGLHEHEVPLQAFTEASR